MLLAEVQKRTGSRALDANIALLADNASLAARVAAGLMKDVGRLGPQITTQSAAGDSR